MSTKTGCAPVDRIALTVALKVWPTVMTSSPGPRPRPAKTHIRATVPLLTAIAWRTPMKAAQRSSSSATRVPPASIPLRRTSVTAAISVVADVRASDRDHDRVLQCRASSVRSVVHIAALEAGRWRSVRVGRGRCRRVAGVAAGAHPADPPGRVADDERVVLDPPGDDRPAPTSAKVPMSQPATTTAPAPIEQPSARCGRGDGPVVGPGEVAGRGDGARVAVVGEDRARPDEHAVPTVTPW